MQYRALATLLFATAALAVPASEATNTSDDWLDNIELPIETETIPSGILSVIETAIPSTWYQALETDSAFQSSVINDLLHGIYPAWYSSLPDSVKSWATSEGEAEVSVLSSYFGAIPTVTPTGSHSAGRSSHSGFTPLSTGHNSTTASTPLTLTSTATQTSTASTSGSSTTSASGSGTSTSTAGAPAATGGLAISLAGAAGVLGLALAL